LLNSLEVLTPGSWFESSNFDKGICILAKEILVRAFILPLVLLWAAAALAEVGVVTEINLKPAGSFKATTKEIQGEATQVGEAVQASNVIVKLKNLKTGIALRDKHATEKYLEVEKYPEAILVSATGTNGKGTGKLKIRGIEKDIEGTYNIAGPELTAEFPIKLSDFGISGIRYLGVGVSDDVKLQVTLPLKKISPPLKKKK
jgi:polyisoprenoid-binding protein YceI